MDDKTLEDRYKIQPDKYSSQPDNYYKTIAWHMMDKKKYIPLSFATIAVVKTSMYPLNELQSFLGSRGRNYTMFYRYRPKVDVLEDPAKLYRFEGFGATYRGRWRHYLSVFTGVAYQLTYEYVRHILGRKYQVNDTLRTFIAGWTAAFVGQTLIVPLEVISQHWMIFHNFHKYSETLRPVEPLAKMERTGSKETIRTGSFRMHRWSQDIIMAIFKRDGIRGFYRGFTISLWMFCPTSAIFWTICQAYTWWYDDLSRHLRFNGKPIPFTAVQAYAALSAASITAIVTNPMDLARRKAATMHMSIFNAMRLVAKQHGARCFIEGVAPRWVSGIMYCVVLVTTYETAKKLSVYHEYEPFIKW